MSWRHRGFTCPDHLWLKRKHQWNWLVDFAYLSHSPCIRVYKGDRCIHWLDFCWGAEWMRRVLISTKPFIFVLFAGIPQVERAIAVHLCPRNAATWRNRPRLPSKACKLTAALAAKAYNAAGQAASALHAMAIMQVHQAKVLKQVHEGSTDPGLMQELRSATDFALLATKVTAWSLGKGLLNKKI